VRSARNRFCGNLRRGIMLALAFTILVSAPVLAYLYRAPLAVTENASASYDMLSVLWDQNNTWLADNGFMNSSGNDTRVQTLGGLNKPHLVADNKTLTAIPVLADSQTNLYFVTGESELSTMDIILGHDGYFTVADDPTIEPRDDFEIVVNGYFDTDNGTNKNIAYKPSAFKLSVSDTTAGDIIAQIISDNSSWVSPTSHVANGWGTPALAWDNNLGTWADLPVGGSLWTAYLELYIASVSCDSIRLYWARDNADIDDLEIDVYYSGGWVNIYTGGTPASGAAYPIGSTEDVTAARVRFWNSGVPVHTPDIIDLYFWQISESVTATLSATGVASGEHEVSSRIGSDATSWWDTEWGGRQLLTFDNSSSSENLTDFPVLVHLDSSNFDFGDAQTSGEDIRFISEGDNVTLDYEIETWESTEAWIWVEVPQIDAGSGSDFIYMYYGNPTVPDGQNITGTWNAGYDLVMHMVDDTTSTVLDSTSNNNDGTKKAANEPLQTTGIIGYGQSFNGSQSITLGAAPILTGDSAYTMEYIVKPDTLGGHKYIFNTNTPVFDRISSGKHRIGVFTGGWIYAQSGVDYFAGNTYYMGSSYNSTDIYLLKDGLRSVVTAQVNAMIGVNNDIIGATDVAGTNGWDGLIDEFRLSNVARSEDWTTASYLSNSEQFITFGPEIINGLRLYIDGTFRDWTGSANIPDTSENWIFMQNNSMVYADSIVISVNGTEVSRYEPTSMILVTNLPDETGSNDGVITWGSNPAGLEALLGSFVSSGQPSVSSTTDTSTTDRLPVVGGLDWDAAPDIGVGGALLANPFRPLVTVVSDNTTLSERQVWVWYGIIFVVFITVLTGANVRGHHLITGVAAGAAMVVMIVWTVFPILTLVIVVLAVIGGLVSERSPSL